MDGPVKRAVGGDADARDPDFCAGSTRGAAGHPDGTFVLVDRSEPACIERLAWEGGTADALARLTRHR